MRHLLTRLPFVFAAGLIIASFSAAAQSPTPAGSWTRKAPMPAVRGEVAAAAVDNKLFALGGGAGGKAVPRNEEYDPARRYRRRAIISASPHTAAKSTRSAALPPRCTKGPATWCSHMILQPIFGRRSRR